MSKKIVSVQDISCYGQCSLTVALPVLSARGVETAILPSGILSTHTGGFKGFTFLDLTDEMQKIINHWKSENITFDAIYTGYIGDARQFDMIKDMKKMLNPDGKLIVDPAMADHGKMYYGLGSDILEGMREIVRDADMILPNLTEASFLLGKEYKESFTTNELEEMAKALSEMGPETVILTGASDSAEKIGALAYEKSKDKFTAYYTEKQEKSYHGTGDIFSSILIADYMNGMPLEETLKDACEFIVSCIQKTVEDKNHNYGVKFEEVLLNERR